MKNKKEFVWTESYQSEKKKFYILGPSFTYRPTNWDSGYPRGGTKNPILTSVIINCTVKKSCKWENWLEVKTEYPFACEAKLIQPINKKKKSIASCIFDENPITILLALPVLLYT